MAAPTRLRTAARMRRVNNLIWESLDHGGHDQAIPFFCECGDEGCYLPVWLTPAEYEEARRHPDWTAVASAHEEAAA